MLNELDKKLDINDDQIDLAAILPKVDESTKKDPSKGKKGSKKKMNKFELEK